MNSAVALGRSAQRRNFAQIEEDEPVSWSASIRCLPASSRSHLSARLSDIGLERGNIDQRLHLGVAAGTVIDRAAIACCRRG